MATSLKRKPSIDRAPEDPGKAKKPEKPARPAPVTSRPDRRDDLVKTRMAALREAEERLGQAQEAQRDSEERYRRLFESMTEGFAVHEIVTDKTGRPVDYLFLDMNPAFEPLTGLRRADLLGKRALEALPGLEAEWIETYGRVALTGEPARFQSFSASLGRWYDVVAYRPAPRQFATIFADITEHKRAEEALRESQAKYQNLIETTSDFIWEMDARGTYTYCSPQMETLWGIKPETMIGKTPFDQMPSGAKEEGLEFFRRAAASKTPFSGVQVPSLDGRGNPITIETSGVPFFDDRGELAGYRGVTRDVTERERTQKEMLAREALLQALTDNSPDAIYVKDTQSRWLMANPAVLRIVGRSAQEALGKTDLELYADPEIGRVILENDRRILEGRKAETFEEPADTPEGRKLFLSTKAPWIDNKGRIIGLIGISHDITEDKRADDLREALAEQDRLRLGAAVEQASDSVVMVDLDGTIRYVNAAFETMNLMPRAQAVGRSYFDFLAGQSADIGIIREAIGRGQAWHGLMAGSVARPGMVEIEVTISPTVDPAGKVIGGLITEKNVTQENALQRQLRQAQKMEALGTLAGGITHDFNNVLGAIVLNTELALLDLEPGHPSRNALPTVLKAANRGKELVRQIITFSRQREWEKRSFEVAPVVRDAIAFLRATLPDNVTIRETLDPGAGAVFGDPSQLNQIVVNLCQNAAQAIGERDGLLRLELEPVLVDEAMSSANPDLKTGPHVRLTVGDNGSGMSPEVMERIFEPFFTTRKSAGGTGLGLAVVHGIVKNHGGAIAVASDPGKGTVFSVYIPRWEGEVPAAPEPKYFGHNGRGERVLLVEDDVSQRNSLSSGLRKIGYKVVSKPSGVEALETFRTAPAAYDIVITDQLMPGMSGLDMAAEISRLRSDIPIILCTGFSERVDQMTVGQNGIRELIMKPFTLRELSQLIRKVLRPTIRVSS